MFDFTLRDDKSRGGVSLEAFPDVPRLIKELPCEAHLEFRRGTMELCLNGNRRAYFAATAMRGHSSICTRAKSL
jgi:hypothetical protein